MATELETRVRRGLEALAETCAPRPPTIDERRVLLLTVWPEQRRVRSRQLVLAGAAAVAIALLAAGMAIGRARNGSQTISPAPSPTDTVPGSTTAMDDPASTIASAGSPPSGIPTLPEGQPPAPPPVDPNRAPYDIVAGHLALTVPSGWAAGHDEACIGSAHTIVITELNQPCATQSDSFIWIETARLDVLASGCQRGELNGVPGCSATEMGFVVWALDGAGVTLLYPANHDPAVDAVLRTVRVERPEFSGPTGH